MWPYIFICLVLIINGQIQILSQNKDYKFTKIQEIFTNKNPIWLRRIGMMKGIEQDRQHLGLILPANSALSIRRLTGRSRLTLRLLNDNNRTEQRIYFRKNWIDVTNLHVSVPFIDTPYGDDNVSIEFKYSRNAKTLPVFKKLDNEKGFFRFWDSTNAEFALISNDYFNMLVPGRDRTSLKNLNSTPNVNGLIEEYEKLFGLYNELVGLSFEPFQKSDQNIGDKYFIKANQGNPSVGVYRKEWVTEAGGSIKDIWLNVDVNNWRRLLVVAYGYTGYFVTTTTFPTKILWANVIAAIYQDLHFGKDVFKHGHLYKDSRKLFETVRNNIMNNIEVSKWDDKAKLLFFMLMNDAGGKGTFAQLNQKLRRLTMSSSFVPEEVFMLDFLSELYIEASKVDMTLFIKRVGGVLTSRQVLKNSYHHVPVVYPLFLMVDEAVVSEIQEELSLKTPFSLVTPLQLAPTGLKGNVTINLIIDKMQEIFLETLSVLEGERSIYHIKITKPTIELVDLPIGVYTLSLPLGKSSKYQVDQNELIVRQGNNQIDVQYNLRKDNNLVQQYFDLMGFQDYKFAAVQIDLPNRLLLISVMRVAHPYYGSEKYANIVVRNSAGVAIYNKMLPGAQTGTSVDQVEFQYGDSLEIFHAEPHRLKLHGVVSAITFSNQSSTFTLTKIGLDNAQINASETLPLLIEQAAEGIRNNPKWTHQKFMPLKGDIFLAVGNLPTEVGEELLDRYKDVLPIDNSPPNPFVSDVFTFTFDGEYYETFLRVTIDFVDLIITFDVFPGQPSTEHLKLYASVMLLDSYGSELFSKSFNGNEQLESFQEIFQLSYSGGEQLLVFHKQGCGNEYDEGRLVVTNEMLGLTLEGCGYNIYRLVDLRLSID